MRRSAGLVDPFVGPAAASPGGPPPRVPFLDRGVGPGHAPAPMSLRAPALLLAASLLVPVIASAEALEREGTVALLPAVRFPSDADGPAPGFTLSFGLKPTRSLEVGIDLGASRGEGGDGAYTLTTVPLGVSFEWTPMPDRDLRPVLHATVGKGFATVNGDGDYRELTSYFALAGAGLTADLSSDVGLYADAGYLYFRVKDDTLGRLDAGGPLVRAGVYFRWDPLPKRF